MERVPHQLLDPDAPKRRIQIVLHEDDAATFNTLAHSLEWTPSELGRRCVGFYIDAARKGLKQSAPLSA